MFRRHGEHGIVSVLLLYRSVCARRYNDQCHTAFGLQWRCTHKQNNYLVGGGDMEGEWGDGGVGWRAMLGTDPHQRLFGF